MKYNLTGLIICIIAAACSNQSERSDAFGNFEAETLIVSSESPGKILELNVKKGQEINSGFDIALIDTVQLHLKLIQLEAKKEAIITGRQTTQAQIEVLEEQKNNLKINESRILKMLSDGASTQKQLDDIQGQIKVVDQQIKSTKTRFSSISKEVKVLDAQKQILLDQIERCKIKSPISGTILETYAEQSELITPGKALVKLADLNELELKVYASGAQLPNIQIGQQVNVIIDKSENENQTIEGKVEWISSEAEFTPKIIQTKEERVKLVYAVKIAVKNDGRLKIGMPGEVKW